MMKNNSRLPVLLLMLLMFQQCNIKSSKEETAADSLAIDSTQRIKETVQIYEKLHSDTSLAEISDTSRFIFKMAYFYGSLPKFIIQVENKTATRDHLLTTKEFEAEKKSDLRQGGDEKEVHDIVPRAYRGSATGLPDAQFRTLESTINKVFRHAMFTPSEGQVEISATEYNPIVIYEVYNHGAYGKISYQYPFPEQVRNLNIALLGTARQQLPIEAADMLYLTEAEKREKEKF